MWIVVTALGLALATPVEDEMSLAEEPAPDETLVLEDDAPLVAGPRAPAPDDDDQCREAVRRVGTLTVATQPWTRVEVDGKAVGSTPLFKLQLPEGPHRLRFVNAGHGIDVTDEFEIEGGRAHRLDLLLAVTRVGTVLDESDPTDPPVTCEDALVEPGFLTIDASPWARVYVDGKAVGSTPLFKNRVAPGPHAVKLVSPGDPDRATLTRVVVAKGENVKLRFGEPVSASGQPLE